MKPTKIEITPILSLADVAGLTINATCELYANRGKVASKVFIEQGKLVHHLRNSKLKPGQTIYGLLRDKQVSEGSVQSAVVVADLIDALVIAGHLTEARFDECITFRTSRMGRQLFQGKAKSGLKLDGPALAALMLSGTTAAVGAELDCLCEHGVTIAERETALAEQAAQAAADSKAAAELVKIQAAEAAAKALQDAADAQAKAVADALAAATPAPSNVTPISTPAAIAAALGEDEPDEEEDAAPAPAPAGDPLEDEEEDEEQAAPTPEPEPAAEPADEEDEDETPAPVVVDGTKDRGTPPPPPAPPAGPTLASITGELNDTLVKAFDLSAEDLEALVHFLRATTNDIAATLDSLKAVA
jgi:hypothetical protein